MLALTTAAAVLFAVANAQSAPDWNLIPRACATDCAQTIQASYLCSNQYTGGTAIYGCFCEAFPSDAAACATCLTSNNAASLGALLTATQTDCPAQIQSCAFACAFDTCDSADVACQCSASYLANIYNCASCNTANGNSATGLDDFRALNESCGAQSYAGATQAYTTFVQSPTGTAAYQAPALTGTGGGEAATGSFQPATDKAAATVAQSGGAGAAQPSASAPAAGTSAGAAGAAGSAAPAASSGAGAVASGASSAAAAAGSAAASGASSAAAGASSAAAAAGSSANGLVAPAGVVALVAGVAALL